jgi:hypothetical protein
VAQPDELVAVFFNVFEEMARWARRVEEGGEVGAATAWVVGRPVEVEGGWEDCQVDI